MPQVRFTVEAVVVHDVPLRGDPDPLTLTEAPVALDDQLRAYFSDKVRASLTARGLDVVADTTAESQIVRDGVAAVIEKPDALVAESQRFGQHLYDLQERRNSPGLLAVIRGSRDGTPCVAVLKLEREQGLRVRLNTAGGKTVIDLEYLRDLTLTDKTKVFKTALLWLGDRGNPASMQGIASDDQRGYTEGILVAQFFLHKFLGCALKMSPEKITLELFEVSETFINDDLTDPNKKARCQIALLAYLQDASNTTLNPEQFGRTAIESEADRQAFRRRLQASQIDPRTTFELDRALVERKIKGFKLTFESGMTLIGRKEDLEQRVQLPSADDASTRINDTIKRIYGR